MSNRNVVLWESPYDLQRLASNGFNFCIAKSVIDSSGMPTFNMVWKSLALAPRASVSWTTQYGLNWSLDVPTGNAQVTLGGLWQACNPGQVYDIDSLGLFQPSSVPSQPGYLKVGKNGYAYGGSSGIHIIVGVQSPSGDFDPVYVDTTALAPNMSSWYQPQEKAEWWYEKGVQSGSMISGATSQICTYDLTQKNPNTNTYFVSTTFTYDTGIWSTSYGPPPSAKATGLMKSFGPLNNSLNDSALDSIRGSVMDIMEVLAKLGHQVQIGAPGPEFYYGLVRFATVAYCTHGVKTIVQSLTGKDYQVDVTLDATKMVANVKVAPSSKFGQAVGSADGVTVPQQVVNDWNAAVKADAVDKPTNQGISTNAPQSFTNKAIGAAEEGINGDFSAADGE